VLSNVLVAEHYLAGAGPPRAETLTRLLGAANARLRHALFLPGDETYFAVYDSTSAEAVRAATATVTRPNSPHDRIVRAVLLDPMSALEPRTNRREK
jgi:hypothetical protein